VAQGARAVGVPYAPQVLQARAEAVREEPFGEAGQGHEVVVGEYGHGAVAVVGEQVGDDERLAASEASAGDALDLVEEFGGDGVALVRGEGVEAGAGRVDHLGHVRFRGGEAHLQDAARAAGKGVGPDLGDLLNRLEVAGRVEEAARLTLCLEPDPTHQPPRKALRRPPV
jgi:hypothetical protein